MPRDATDYHPRGAPEGPLERRYTQTLPAMVHHQDHSRQFTSTRWTQGRCTLLHPGLLRMMISNPSVRLAFTRRHPDKSFEIISIQHVLLPHHHRILPLRHSVSVGLCASPHPRLEARSPNYQRGQPFPTTQDTLTTTTQHYFRSPTSYPTTLPSSLPHFLQDVLCLFLSSLQGSSRYQSRYCAPRAGVG